MALDLDCVLRLIGTVHREAGQVVWALTPVGRVWTFDALADEILPLTRRDSEATHAATMPRREARRPLEREKGERGMPPPVAVQAGAQRNAGVFDRALSLASGAKAAVSGHTQRRTTADAGGSALTLRPRLLILDEPSLGLAPRVVAEVFGALRTIRERRGLAILLVEQNAAQALGIVDEVVLLENGRPVFVGRQDDPAIARFIQRAYLGGAGTGANTR